MLTLSKQVWCPWIPNVHCVASRQLLSQVTNSVPAPLKEKCLIQLISIYSCIVKRYATCIKYQWDSALSGPCEVVFCVVFCLNVCFVTLSLNFLIKPTEHLLVTGCPGNYQATVASKVCLLDVSWTYGSHFSSVQQSHNYSLSAAKMALIGWMA